MIKNLPRVIDGVLKKVPYNGLSGNEKLFLMDSVKSEYYLHYTKGNIGVRPSDFIDRMSSFCDHLVGDHSQVKRIFFLSKV